MNRICCKSRLWKKETERGEIGSERECPIIVLVTIESSCLRATFMWIRWENRKVKIPFFRLAILPSCCEGRWECHLAHADRKRVPSAERMKMIVSSLNRSLKNSTEIFLYNSRYLSCITQFSSFCLSTGRTFQYFTLVVCCTLARIDIETNIISELKKIYTVNFNKF